MTGNDLVKGKLGSKTAAFQVATESGHTRIAATRSEANLWAAAARSNGHAVTITTGVVYIRSDSMPIFWSN